MPKLQHAGSAADGLLHHRTSETGTACPFIHPRLMTCPCLLIFLVHQWADARRPRRQSPRTTKGYLERRRPRHPATMALEIWHVYLRERASAGANEPAHALLCLHRQPASHALDSSSSNDSQEASTDDLSGSTLANDSDGDTLVGGEPESIARTTRPGTICYGDIDLFLLRNPDNPERDILMAEVDFRNLKGRPEGADG